MREFEVAHDSFTFPIIYKAIWSLGCRIENGEMVHCVAMQMGFGQDVYFGNSLLEVHVKYESIGNTSKLFDEMTHRHLVLSHFRSLSFFFLSFFVFLCHKLNYFFNRQFYNLGFIIINLIIIIIIIKFIYFI